MNNKILLIDNDTEPTLALKKYLESEAFDVYICSDGTEGVNEASHGQYNLIILDIVTPSLNGFELLKELKAAGTCPVMVMTARNEDFDRIYALEIGADDYLLKSVNQRELLARIKVVMRRHTVLGYQTLPGNININHISLCRSTREVYYGEHLLKLTGAEFEVLYFLMSNAGKISSKENIGKLVFGRPISYYDRSIEMHISNIRKKISLHGKETLIKTVRGIGYTFLTNQNYSNNCLEVTG